MKMLTSPGEFHDGGGRLDVSGFDDVADGDAEHVVSGSWLDVLNVDLHDVCIGKQLDRIKEFLASDSEHVRSGSGSMSLLLWFDMIGMCKNSGHDGNSKVGDASRKMQGIFASVNGLGG
jgi:hypothetical protein